MLMGLTTVSVMSSCQKDEEEPTPVTPVTYGSITKYNTKLMGGQTNTTVGSFFSTETGMVYGEATAGADVSIQRVIDLVYFFGTTNHATIAAPSDSTAQEAHNQSNGTDELKNWTVKNATTFKTTTLSAADFVASANDSLAITALSGGATLSKVNELVAGQVVAFQTAKGKKGLFHVVSIDGQTGLDRSITINVLVQQ